MEMDTKSWMYIVVYGKVVNFSPFHLFFTNRDADGISTHVCILFFPGVLYGKVVKWTPFSDGSSFFRVYVIKNGIQMGNQLMYVSRFVLQSRKKDLILRICEKRDGKVVKWTPFSDGSSFLWAG